MKGSHVTTHKVRFRRLALLMAKGIKWQSFFLNKVCNKTMFSVVEIDWTDAQYYTAFAGDPNIMMLMVNSVLNDYPIMYQHLSQIRQHQLQRANPPQDQPPVTIH